MADHLTSIPGMDPKAMDAFESAFQSMTKWRDQISQAAERNSEHVFDQLGTAAKAAGWPDALIDTTKTQMMQASKMQTDMIDHMLQAWQSQIKSPGSPGQLMGSLNSIPGMNNLPGFNGKPVDMANLAMLPTQLMLQSMEMWRKNWTDAMAMWTGGMNKAMSQDDTTKR